MYLLAANIHLHLPQFCQPLCQLILEKSIKYD